MPSSWSASLRFELQFDGENTNTWGAKLNVVFQHVDYAIAGWLTKPLSGDYALTTANAGDDEARAGSLKFTGALGVPATITLPPVSKRYFVWNATNQPLTFTTGAGGAVTIDAGDKAPIACDGGAVHTINFGGLDLKAFIAASALAATGTLPAAAGNAGKWLYCDGTNWLPRQPATTDLADYAAWKGKMLAYAVAL